MPRSTQPSIPFGARSTAEEVLAGLDLTGKTILVTGCNAGIGFDTMQALARHGAHVIGLARTMASAQDACTRAGAQTPMACDLADLGAVTRIVAELHALGRPLDAIVANAGLMGQREPERRYGMELQFLVNHVAHHLLVTRLTDIVPDGTGRIVVVSSSVSIQFAPREGILFDDLDGRRGYRPLRFYGQSKLANALFAKELSRRLAGRGIIANSLHPGAVFGTRLLRNASPPLRLLGWVGPRFSKSLAQGAATQTLLAASPMVAGITGEYWADCQIAKGSRYLDDPAMASRLWDVTETLIAAATDAG